MDATAIILAAGEGTRMKSNHCKVSHKILGKPMVQWIVDATIKAGCSRVVVVIGSHADEMRALIDGAYANSATKVECVEQTERLGTGHAVKVALEACGITQGPVVVLNGDLPLITADTVAKFAQTVATGELACTVMTMTPPDPFGYGRIKLGADGQIERIIEQKDCTPEQAATLLECNAGCYAFDGAQLAAHINEIGNDNAQSEYYLPDMLEILKGHGQAVSIFTVTTTATAWASTAASSSRSSPPSRATASTSTGWPRALPSSTPRRPGSAPMPSSAATPSCGRRRI